LELCPKSIKFARNLGLRGSFGFLGKIGKKKEMGKKAVRRRLREAGGGGVVVGE
jgi:hypothetical protein